MARPSLGLLKIKGFGAILPQFLSFSIIVVFVRIRRRSGLIKQNYVALFVGNQMGLASLGAISPPAGGAAHKNFVSWVISGFMPIWSSLSDVHRRGCRNPALSSERAGFRDDKLLD